MTGPVVYRMYDADDRLIYIGATKNLSQRMEGHGRLSWWLGLVAKTRTQAYPTMAAAFAAETVAIQEEQPAFNVRGTTAGPALTVADAEAAQRWRRTPGNYVTSLTVIDRMNEVLRAAAISNAA